MANENVEPIITIAEGLAARLIGVPDIVIAEEPGVRVWLSSRYLPTGSAVSVWASSSRTELAWVEAVESEIVEEPMMIWDGLSEMRVPERVIAWPGRRIVPSIAYPEGAGVMAWPAAFSVAEGGEESGMVLLPIANPEEP